MSRIINISDPFNLEFPILDRWPFEDGEIGSVSVEARVMLVMPHANMFNGEADPLTHVVTEANRVLREGGTLELKAPYHLHNSGLGHPMQQRIYNQACFYAYGCPENAEHPISKQLDTGGIALGVTEKPIDPNTHPWNWWHGVDFGVKMRVISLQHDEHYWIVFYQKFRQDEIEDDAGLMK